MNQKDKALKTALTAVALLAIAMVAYYWVSWRMRKTENDVNFSEKAEAPAEERATSEFSGVYSAGVPIEGMNYRFAFFSINRREDGSGFFGTAKADAIGAETETSIFLKCDHANIGEKEFFVKCHDDTLGEISFGGEWTKSGGTIQVPGHLLWSKDGAEITNKDVTLTRTGSG
jgi:hypothetical protein